MNAEDLGFKNIVVGLDFTKYSQIVLRQATVLAEKFKARLHLIYVAEEPIFLGPTNVFASGFAYVPPKKKEMLESLKAFYKLRENENVSLVFKVGEPARQIMKLAASLEKPLIVAGATGRGGFARFMLGSQAEKLALEAPCPVWIHRGQRLRHFQYLLLPVDFSANTQKVVDLFKAAPFPVRLNYLFVKEAAVPVLDYASYIQWQRSLKKEVAAFLNGFKKSNPGLKLKIAEGDVIEEIVDRSINYDLVVMTPHNKSGVFNKFGKVTSKVIRLANVPVLVIKP